MKHYVLLQNPTKMYTEARVLFRCPRCEAIFLRDFMEYLYEGGERYPIKTTCHFCSKPDIPGIFLDRECASGIKDIPSDRLDAVVRRLIVLDDDILKMKIASRTLDEFENVNN